MAYVSLLHQSRRRSSSEKKTTNHSTRYTTPNLTTLLHSLRRSLRHPPQQQQRRRIPRLGLNERRHHPSLPRRFFPTAGRLHALPAPRLVDRAVAVDAEPAHAVVLAARRLLLHERHPLSACGGAGRAHSDLRVLRLDRADDPAGRLPRVRRARLDRE